MTAPPDPYSQQPWYGPPPGPPPPPPPSPPRRRVAPVLVAVLVVLVALVGGGLWFLLRDDGQPGSPREAVDAFFTAAKVDDVEKAKLVVCAKYRDTIKPTSGRSTLASWQITGTRQRGGTTVVTVHLINNNGADPVDWAVNVVREDGSYRVCGYNLATAT